MRRRGFALLAVLWFVVVAGGLALVAAARGRAAFAASANRVALARGRWAREACLAVLRDRLAGGAPAPDSLELALGGPVWCRVSVRDPAARLNVNTAAPEAIGRIVGSSMLAARIADWRDPDDAMLPDGAEGNWYRVHRRPGPRNSPLVDLSELGNVAGMEAMPEASLASALTTWGDGRINPNTAPLEVVSTLPGLDAAALALLADARRRGERFVGPERWIAGLPAESRAVMLAHFRELAPRLVWRTEELVVTASGGVAGSQVIDSAVILLRLLPGRTAIVRRMAR